MQFDESKLDKVSQDFSIFHPTVGQMKLIYELSSMVAEQLGIEWSIVRTIYIKSLIKYQHKTGQFHFNNEKNLPQAKIVRSTEINELIIDEIVSCLEKQTQEARKEVQNVIERVFSVYIEKYAGRELD